MAKKKKRAVERADLAIDRKIRPLETSKAVKKAGEISEAADRRHSSSAVGSATSSQVRW